MSDAAAVDDDDEDAFREEEDMPEEEDLSEEEAEELLFLLAPLPLGLPSAPPPFKRRFFKLASKELRILMACTKSDMT